ncbi:alpha/beta hydrolase fold domain-containing protein [Kribbella sp. GL6]|uniref:alpha/beta hydrolase fold domain-containing protein n=1 Tax=Kribbella sp. GL6 TaxID=3419765 RepID=UPI003D040A86
MGARTRRRARSGHLTHRGHRRAGRRLHVDGLRAHEQGPRRHRPQGAGAAVPVTNADFDTPSYLQFAEGYFLTRDGMQWLWDAYTTDPAKRAEKYASPLQATLEDLKGLPPTLVITDEADVLRDEGEMYANKLREAGVDVTSVRVQGMVHDFLLLDSLRDAKAANIAATSRPTPSRRPSSKPSGRPWTARRG